MVQHNDVILEGVKAQEFARLSALARGETLHNRQDMAPLFAKGWVELAGGEPLITLTGRTLLDHPPTGFL